MPLPYAWEQLIPESEIIPTPRSGHSLTKLDRGYFLFGGMVADTGDRTSIPGPSNDAYFLRVNGRSSCVWDKIECDKASLPSPRTLHSATSISDSKVFIFGGVLSCGPFLCSNDGYIFDANNSSFQKVQWGNGKNQGSQIAGSFLGSRRGSKMEGLTREQAQEQLKQMVSSKKTAKGASLKPKVGQKRQGDVDEIQVFHETMLALVQPNEGDALAGEAADLVPAPRSNHSIVFYKGNSEAERPDQLILFGGHGGRGYRRKAFKDLYILNLQNFTWEKRTAQGYPPPERAGHSAFIKGQDMFVFGGWNSETQFNDLIRLNLEKFFWEDVEQPWPNSLPRWNMSAQIVEAIPSWKVFIFGGSTGQFDEGAIRAVGNFDSNVGVLTLEDRAPEGDEKFPCNWSDPSLQYPSNGGKTTTKGFDGSATMGRQSMNLTSTLHSSTDAHEIPKPTGREHAAVCYDSDESQLVVFGGWAHKWMNDIWALNVTSVVGPPYAISSITPCVGPLSGGNEVVIGGFNFIEGAKVVVRFSFGRNYLDCPGSYISSTQIRCNTPHMGVSFPNREGPTEVRISIANKDFTTSSCTYDWFINTDAENTIAYGPGVISGGQCGVPTSFFIQAKNQKNENRKTGKDRIVVKITQKKNKDGPVEIPVEIPHDITDNDNGTYTITYTPPAEPCEVSTMVFVHEDPTNEVRSPLRGTPFVTSFTEKPKPNSNELTGPLVSAWIRKSLEDLDKYHKETSAGIALDIEPNDVRTLISIRKDISSAESSSAANNLLIDTIRETLAALTLQQVNTEPIYKRLKHAQESQASLMAAKKKREKEIAPMVSTEQDRTRQQVKSFEAEISKFLESAKTGPYLRYEIGVTKAFAELDAVSSRCNDTETRLKELEHVSSSFDITSGAEAITAESGRLLEQVRAEAALYRKLWVFTDETLQIMANFAETRWEDIIATEMEEEIKARVKLQRDVKVDNKVNAYMGISRELKSWLSLLPKVAELKDEAMRDRHWNLLRVLVEQDFTITDDTPLQLIIDLKLDRFNEQVGEITEQAKQEAKMEKNMGVLDAFWLSQLYIFSEHKASGLHVAKIEEEVQERLEDHQMLVQGMLSNRFLPTFEREVLEWQRVLNNIFDVSAIFGEVSRLWMFLENLFIHSAEVKKELPEATIKFEAEDKKVREIIREAFAVKNIKDFTNKEGIYKYLEDMKDGLTICETALHRFMDDKRTDFPRFYFVSQSDLLDILSNGNTPVKVMEHMPKIFKAIKSFELDTSDASVRPFATAIESCEGIETVTLSERFQLEGKVETYLDSLIEAMRSSLKYYARKSIQDRYASSSRREWVLADPVAQIALLTNMAAWCHDVEVSLVKASKGDKHATKTAYGVQVEALTDLIKMVQGHLDDAMRQRIMCLITMDTHGRDILDRIVIENVSAVSAFQWQSQLKFYWDKDQDDMRINICDAVFYYGYEYLGNGPRLVVTPLTDRIYVTATQALHLCMGCAPAGPAGTGKTETTKDLASALAKACYVFNCSDQMDYQSMGNIFKGLAASGSWGCFDEFNRLIPEVLSVCSVQFKAVVDGIKAGADTFVLQGDVLKLDATCGAFITMNPGYLGRSELPEGLKALFRPITVMVPDLELICENMLMAQGFVEAKQLARKFTRLYALNRDLLSKAKHYDWGLRAIKSVLVVAGSFKRNEPDMAESGLLMRALRDTNLAKIVGDDLQIFSGLLSDLFPGQNPPANRDPTFRDRIVKACEQEGLIPEEEFVLKVIQLDELLAIRHCVFVMGTAAAGKSSIWKILSKVKERCTVVDINPKSITSNELYGYVTLGTREWKDGLLSKSMRSLGKEPNTDPKWLILDGDLDANWIESMNSVMDDNKLLTLASNERISLLPHMRMIFEIRDLNYATPATVSRAGIVYIDDSTGYQWKAYHTSWIKRLKPEIFSDDIKSQLEKLFPKYLPQTLKFVQRQCKSLIPVVDMSMVMTICQMLQAILSIKEYQAAIEYWFVLCVIWACGGPLSEKDGIDYRKSFDRWWKAECKTIKFPPNGTVFDYYVDGARMEEWTKLLKPVPFDSSRMNLRDVTVNTTETVAMNFFIQQLELESKWPVMLVGLAGSGKTQLCKGLLGSLRPDKFQSCVINCNYYTDSALIQLMLEQPLEKKGKNLFPLGQARLIYFIDDINMPQLDKYNTQTAIELLRQNADYSHWYDRTKMELVNVMNTQYLAAMNPTAGSFIINPRLQRHFFTLAVPFPEQAALQTIFNTFLQSHFSSFKTTIQEQVSSYIKAGLQLHASVAQTFRKTAANFHYEFNIRHLTNVFGGILKANNERYDSDKLIALFIHEAERIYGDRLVSVEDLRKYQTLAAEVAKKHFVKTHLNFNKMFADKEPSFNVFTPYAVSLQDGSYDQVDNVEKLSRLLGEALNDYNETYARMDLVLFEDAMKHVCRVSRIITTSQGHALLVGVGGSGKQSLSRLAGHTCQFNLETIHIKSGYSVTDLKTELQLMYNKAGVKDEGTMFLLNEGQVTNEKFLVYINDLLCSGEIADLYNSEDKDVILNNCRAAAKSADAGDSREKIWDFFIKRIRNNLHMSLCFSPVGESLRSRVRKFPALVNCTVIDWFQPWPKDALKSVAEKFLKELPLADEHRESIVEFMPFSFEAVNDAARVYGEVDRRFAYSTPKSFLELIKLYGSMLKKRIGEIEGKRDMLADGLDKLRSTAAKVADLEIELQDVKVTAAEAMKVATEIAEYVGQEKAKVEVESQKANDEAEKAAAIQSEVFVKKADANRKLDQAGPAVARATEALSTLEKNKKNFVTLKSLNNPPLGVGDVMMCVTYLFAGVFPSVEVDKKGQPVAKELTWAGGRKLISSPDAFIKSLQDFKQAIDDSRVPASNFANIQYLLERDYFNAEEMQKKSVAAAGVVEYILNINDYYNVYMQVEPLRKEVAEFELKLAEANEKNDIAQTTVKKLNEELSVLIKQSDEAQAKKKAEEDKLRDCENKLSLATRLINALSSENERWAQSIDNFTEELKLIPGDVLLASAFVSYVGVFTKKYRDSLINDKFLKFLTGRGVPMSSPPNPLSVLTTPAQVAVWNQQALPADQVSTENGAILVNSERWPLMIDPQLQGITWIREKEKANKLEVIRMNTPKKDLIFDRTMSQGCTLMIENMGESIEASIAPAIFRQFFVRNNNKFCRLGDSEIGVNHNFRLILHTKLSNPHYPPEIQAECTLINFTVTEQGLEDQLLNIVVGKERPDLARKRRELIESQNRFKIELDRLERNLLTSLTESKGDILENVELIEGLEETKRVSQDIEKKVKVAKVTEQLLTEASENYRPVAHRGSLLFFLLTDLSKLHTFYMYSLEAFITVVYRAMNFKEGQEEETAPPPPQPEKPPTPAAAEAKAATAGDEAKVEGKEPVEGAAEGEEAAENGADAEAKAENDEAVDSPAVINGGDEDEEDEHADSEDNDGSDAGSDAGVEKLSGKALLERVRYLINIISIFVFNYCRRGLFERHKIIVAAMLCFRVLQDEGTLTANEVSLLISGKGILDGNAPDSCRNWGMTDAMWRVIKAIEVLPKFKVGNLTLSQSLTDDSSSWRRWYQMEKAEAQDLPRSYKSIDPLYHMLLLRALRPDRLTYALRDYVQNNLGEDYIVQEPFEMYKTYLETDAKIPIFFVLFPGVDPTPLVEGCAKSVGCTAANGKFVNISMGQGQEKIASNALQEAGKNGGWVMLQNVHLMETWLKKEFEPELEAVAENAHADFRCVITSEPPPMSDRQIVPESILQKCVKVADEAPQDLKANFQRAFSKFTPSFFESCTKKAEFKTLIFALCFFHAVILGRKKFGAWGWSRMYSFNDGDLTICGDVLKNYLDGSEHIPYEDLRYIFGEIMYGGHITDAWDRRTNNVYLEEIIVPGILTGESIIPNKASQFRAPDITKNYSYEVYMKQVKSLPPENPTMFGLHPNAEIGYLTQQSDFVFTSIQEIAGGSGGGGSNNRENEVKKILEGFLARLPSNFDLLGIKERVRANGTLSNPYVIVSLQEAERMNLLLSEIRISLEELRMGLLGQLNISEAMERLSSALYFSRVPENWADMAYASKKTLNLWFDDLLQRQIQIDKWTDKPDSLPSLWVAGFFNPMSFLTAIMQVTARASSKALDHMALCWRVTPYKDPIELPARNSPAFLGSGFTEGEFVHGLFLEGASWEDGKSGTEGNLQDSRPKELHPKLPVINVYALPEKELSWDCMYHCPVYVTSARGATYVTTANLRMNMDDSEAKWVMAGVAALLSDD